VLQDAQKDSIFFTLANNFPLINKNNKKDIKIDAYYQEIQIQ